MSLFLKQITFETVTFLNSFTRSFGKIPLRNIKKQKHSAFKRQNKIVTKSLVWISKQ